MVCNSRPPNPDFSIWIWYKVCVLLISKPVSQRVKPRCMVFSICCEIYTLPENCSTISEFASCLSHFSRAWKWCAGMLTRCMLISSQSCSHRKWRYAVNVKSSVIAFTKTILCWSGRSEHSDHLCDPCRRQTKLERTFYCKSDNLFNVCLYYIDRAN